MTTQTEIELKFIVPASRTAAVANEIAKGSVQAERLSLAAVYLDTEDRRLARAGLSWRLRREGRRWVQTLKSSGTGALERAEHEVTRPGAIPDASVHAGTDVGDRLLRILRAADAENVPVQARFRTEIKRLRRTVRARGAVVEIAFDQGRLVAGEQRLPIRELEFELVSGSVVAMLALAERWRKRFGLQYEPSSKAERGDRLAAGLTDAPVRKAGAVDYPKKATAAAAFAAVLDECLAHITRNAAGLCEGPSPLVVEHLHQMRVGIRRLRSALRCFEDWGPAPPASIVEGIQVLFAQLGMARDSDVLESGVAADLARIGAPSLTLPPSGPSADPGQIVRRPEVQGLLLAWITWSAQCSEHLLAAAVSLPDCPAASTVAEPSEGADLAPPGLDAKAFHREAERRLRRWHSRIAAEWRAFDELDQEGLHALRKRIKRQRYAVEFFAPVLRRREVGRYLKVLAVVQERMGQLNDLFVAKARYQSLVESEPAAWFALGWITARIAEVRLQTKPELGQLASAKPPAR